MQDSFNQQFRELMWRQRLSAEEQSRLSDFLAAHPQLRQEWELEKRLTQSLDRLRPVPVSSNFTARVLQAAAKAPVQKRSWLEQFKLPRWAPQLAGVSLMLALGLFCLRQYDTSHHQQIARDLVPITRTADLPEMDWLKDYEAIDRLSKVQVGDSELLAALQ